MVLLQMRRVLTGYPICPLPPREGAQLFMTHSVKHMFIFSKDSRSMPWVSILLCGFLIQLGIWDESCQSAQKRHSNGKRDL